MAGEHTEANGLAAAAYAACGTATDGAVSFPIGEASIEGIRARYIARLYTLNGEAPMSDPMFRRIGTDIHAQCDTALADLRTALVVTGE